MKFEQLPCRKSGHTDLHRISRCSVIHFDNGNEYYRFHGLDLLNLPTIGTNRPEKQFINWHNENVFKG